MFVVSSVAGAWTPGLPLLVQVTRRICFNEFVLIIKAFARRKGVDEEELFKQICFGAGPMSKPNPEEAAAEKVRDRPGLGLRWAACTQPRRVLP